MSRTEALGIAGGLVAGGLLFGFCDHHPVEDLPNLALLLIAALLFFAVPLVGVALVVVRLRQTPPTRSVMLAGFFAALSFTLGVWAVSEFRRSSHSDPGWFEAVEAGVV